MKRVAPYFKKRGTDATLLARSVQSTSIQRLEDEEDRIHPISLLFREKEEWVITIHERIFDYLAFVIPSDPDSRLGGGTAEEGKMLAFAEFLLRHQMEHILYSDKTEREVIETDVTFAMDRRTSDPTYYKMLGNALSDEMNGIQGAPYLALFTSAEEGRSLDGLIAEMLRPVAAMLGDMPDDRLKRAFPALDRELKARVLGKCYRRSRDTAYSLVRRNAFLQEVLHLFTLLADQGDEEAEHVFSAFKEQWGVASLLHELDLPETSPGRQGRKTGFFLSPIGPEEKRQGSSTPCASAEKQTACRRTQREDQESQRSH
jgi:hypothetical protein